MKPPTFLRRQEIQVFLKSKQVDEVFQWLADELKALRIKIDTAAVTSAFDRGIKVLDTLASRVSAIPVISAKAKTALDQVTRVRKMADQYLGNALKPAHTLVDGAIRKLELQILVKQHGIVDAANIHFRGVIPEAHAVALMRNRKPKFLSSTADTAFAPVPPLQARTKVNELSARYDSTGRPRAPAEQFPELSDSNIASFHRLDAHVIRGPARLYRIVSPSSGAMGDCWITEEIFRKLQDSPNPKEAWRRYLAVWPDWNGNGQFVVFDIKAGETLNAWKGPASSQTKPGLAGHHLEGGWEQILFKTSHGAASKDTMRYYEKKGNTNSKLGKSLTQAQVDALTATMTPSQKKTFFEAHVALRQEINHPNISGPFETGWGYTDFDGAGYSGRIGIPVLPGQATVTRTL